jgi:hypothetical protein
MPFSWREGHPRKLSDYVRVLGRDRYRYNSGKPCCLSVQNLISINLKTLIPYACDTPNSDRRCLRTECWRKYLNVEKQRNKVMKRDYVTKSFIICTHGAAWSNSNALDLCPRCLSWSSSFSSAYAGECQEIAFKLTTTVPLTLLTHWIFYHLRN